MHRQIFEFLAGGLEPQGFEIDYGRAIGAPGDQPDEWVGIGDVMDIPHVMALFLADLLI